MADENALMKALEWVIDVDVSALRGSVETLRAAHPTTAPAELARKVFSRAVWKAAGTGVLTGLPANPWVMVPAAVTDVAVVLRLEVIATAKVALLYDPTFFDEEDAAWELLIPVFGANAASQVARELAVKGGMGLTRHVIRKYLSKETLKQFQRIMLKYFGMKVTQKAVVTKTMPIVGGFIGGAWNAVEVGALRKRAVAYFEKTTPRS